MARATKAEIAARIEELVPLILDGLRAARDPHLGGRQDDLGRADLAGPAEALPGDGPPPDQSQRPDRPPAEIAVAKLRYERALARAAAKGDSKACIAANRGLCELLGLNAPARLEHSVEIDIVAARRTLEAEIAQAIAEAEADASS